MLRRLQHRKLALISLVILALFIFVTAFAFAKGTSPQPTAQSIIAAKRHRTPTPKPTRTHTPTPTPTRAPSPTPTPGITPTPGKTPTATPTVGPTPPAGSGSLQVFTEPQAGEQVILSAISGAHQSIWLEMYLLTDTNVINALETAAKQGIDVRVMLEPHPFGGGSPAATLSALQAAGAKAQASNASFTYTHEKGMVIDGTTAFIMTSNFTFSALNGKNREYGIIDTVPQDVQGVIDIFNADWNRTSEHVSDPNLVISPDNSRTSLTNFISSARSTLLIEAEEMQDTGIINAIASAEQRGVAVQVILPTPSSGSTDSNSAGIATLKTAGVQVEEDPQLIMHAKMMVADGQSAYVGSENFSSNSLDNNRELGLIFSNVTIISTLQQTFMTDWGVSTPMLF